MLPCFPPRRLFCSLALLLAALSAGAATAPPVPDPPPRMAAADLQADFVIFKRALEELHPGLYRYNTPAQMAANFQALSSQLNHDLTLPKAYVAFATFLAKIKCGHSYPNFFNQPDAIVDALFKTQGRVPFYFRWLGRRMIVTRNFSANPRLGRGAEVTRINGVPVKTVLERLLTVARADGSNDAKRISSMEVRGDDTYEPFDIYYPLLYPMKDRRFHLTVRPPGGGRPAALDMDALTYEQRLAPIRAKQAAKRGDGPVWDFKFLNSRTAYLRMPMWDLYDSKWDWKAFLNSAFDQIRSKKAVGLIIDLRGNEGGLSVGNVILSYLIQRDLHLQQGRRWVRYRKVPDDLVPYLDTWDRSFRDWGASAIDPADGFYRLTKYDDDANGDVIKAAPQPFKGHTYVLVDASNSSATFEFAQAVQRNGLGTLVGQPTGGNQRGINGGAFFFLRLPHSRIEADIPLIGQYPPEVRPSLSRQPQRQRPDAGIVPDILVAPSIEDIRAGRDTELTALEVRLKTGLYKPRAPVPTAAPAIGGTT